MREICQSGSEGGGTQNNESSLPLSQRMKMSSMVVDSAIFEIMLR